MRLREPQEFVPISPVSSSPAPSQSAWSRPDRPWALRMLIAAIVALSVIYVLQAFTPLRVTNDSREFLVLGAQLADGGGFPSQSLFPPGMPILVAGLDVAGLARSWGFVMLNLVFLAAGLVAVATILRRDLAYSISGVLAISAITLLAFEIARSVAHPMTEIPFFGLSMVALALASAARRRENLWLLAAAAVLVVAACAVRTFGVALVPALIAALPRRRDRLIALPAIAALGAAGLAVIGPRRYVSEAFDQWREGPLGEARRHIVETVSLVGEVALNAPSTRVPDSLEHVYPLAGLIVLVPLIVGAWAVARRAPVVSTYLAASAGVLFLWPFSDTRFLAPLAPLLVASVVEGIQRLPFPRLRPVALAWASLFVVFGVVALAGTTRISFSGDTFPERYGPQFRATYRVAWGTASQAERVAVDERMLWVLRRYEPRALGEPAATPPP
jgi:hypothetical protein